jgi:Tfp pilus assembly protein PilN
MKEIDINLLPAATRFELQKIKLEKQLKKIAVIVVIVWLVILGLVVAGRLFFRFRLSQLSKKEQNISQAMQEFSPQVNLQQSLRLRVKLAADVLAKRSLFYDRLDRLMSYLPEERELSRLEIERGGIKISGTLPDLVSLNNLEKKLNEMNSKENYRKIDLSSVGQAPSGRWQFSLEVRE